MLRKGSDELTMTQTYLLHRIQGIRFVELISSEYWPLGWSGDLAQIFSLELKTGDDFKQRVWTCLDVLVRNSGRQCFEQHRIHKTYPDHTFWPAALAYALQVGEFAESEMESISFDHGQTVATFVDYYGEVNLLEKILARLTL